MTSTYRGAANPLLAAAATAGACVMVALHVHQPTEIKLTAREIVRLDRLAGTTAERYGELLQPGTTTIRLAEGVYQFRTMTDVQVQAPLGNAITVVKVQSDPKNPWPPPASATATPVGGKGFDRRPNTPLLTLIRAGCFAIIDCPVRLSTSVRTA